MWKPDEVVGHYRRRAIVLWAVLIAAILTYSAWLVREAVKKRENPSTSFQLSNKVYKYPDVWACLFDYYGCDELELEEECVSSMNSTEGGETRARYHPDGENEKNISVRYQLTQERGWCVIFESSEVVTELGKDRDPDNHLDYMLVDMYWYPGGNSEPSTCGVSEGEWVDHSESVYLFLNDSETGIVSTGIQVQYSCMTNASSSHFFNYVGMGLTEENKLDGSVTASYKALSTSSAIYKDQRNAEILGIKRPYAYLTINVAQEPDSWEAITEINPLEVAEVFGNIGGFWDLLRILWPIFFVVTARQDPFLKPRNFKRSVAKAAETAMNVPASVASAVTRRLSTNAMSEEDEERPAWDRPGHSSHHPHQEGGDVLIRLFDEHRLVAVINGAPIKKFLKSQFHAESLRGGASESSLLKLLPPNTYLIVVRPGNTTISIANAVAARCRAGVDSVEDFDVKPIPVKAKRANLSVLQSQALSASTYVEGIDEIYEESDLELEDCRADARQSDRQLPGLAVPGPVLTPALVDDTSSRGVSRSGAQVSDHKHVKRTNSGAQSASRQALFTSSRTLSANSQALSASGRQPVPSDIPRPLC